MRHGIGMVMAAAALAAWVAEAAQPVVRIEGQGAEKTAVAVNVGGAYGQSLRRNLELSGLFVVQPSGAIVVSGTPGGEVAAVGLGKRVALNAKVSDDPSARMAARRLSDAMCETYGRQKGFACDRIAFVNRKGKDNAELCVGYPDGFDLQQLTAFGKGIVGPRWRDPNTIFFTFLKDGPQVWEYSFPTRRCTPRWNFRGLTTGAAVSPDGRRVAIVASFQGNPELYLISGDRYVRLTNTPGASEGQPAWSPDGRQIAYVSDAGRHPQIYVVDVATKKTHRLTATGTQNVDPDWGRDGRLAYTTKRGGVAQIAVMDPRKGEASARLVTPGGAWEHPSWARDGRHIAAECGKALFLVDTLEGGDAPRPIFKAKGQWINPAWCR